MLPDEPTEEERLEQLPQDGEPPFRPADQELDGDLGLNDTHPATDTNIDAQELYDEGVDGAAEISEPNAESNVTGYEKPDELPLS